MIGEDEMQEAIRLGLHSVDGKLCEQTSARMAHGALRAIDELAAMEDIKRSEWIRDACIEKLIKLYRQHECLSKVFGHTTNTLNTSNSTNTSNSNK